MEFGEFCCDGGVHLCSFEVGLLGSLSGGGLKTKSDVCTLDAQYNCQEIRAIVLTRDLWSLSRTK